MDPAAIINAAAANTTSYNLSEIWHFPPPNVPDATAALGLSRAHFGHALPDFGPAPARDSAPASIGPKKRRDAEQEESAKGVFTSNGVVPHSMFYYELKKKEQIELNWLHYNIEENWICFFVSYR